MDTHLHRALTRLEKGTLLRLRNVRGQAIAVFDGDVWITQDGDLRDIFASAGDTFAFDRDGLVIVQALETSRVLVIAADGGGPHDAAPRVVDSRQLHRRARALRDAAIGRMLAHAAAAVKRAVTRALDGLRLQRTLRHQPA